MRQPSSDAPTIKQCSELLDRICASSELRRSGRLRGFLRYVGDRALEGEKVKIPERDIGVNVFGRDQDYNTNFDNIVRVNASELRKRIATYYASHGADETIIVEIPRGSYSPVFSLRSHGVSNNTENHISIIDAEGITPSPDNLKLDAQSSRYLKQRNAVLAVALALAGLCCVFYGQNRTLRDRLYEWKSQPTLGTFWCGFLESPRETDIVVADTSVAVVERILKQRISLNDYLNHSYTQQIQSSHLSSELKGDLEDIAARKYGSVSDFRVARKIADFDPNSSRIHLRYARDYRPRPDGNNLVLIGNSISNPWCTPFEDRLEFFIEYDDTSNQLVVKNRHPQPGESAVYAGSADPVRSFDFSIVDYIPNQDHTGDVLILAGTDSEATESAGDFLASEKSLRLFQSKLQVRTLPYFELLLKTTRLGGVPLSAEVVTYRTYPGPALLRTE